MNRNGFTTLEVLIASVLIICLVTAGAIGFRQIGLLNQFAATRTSHTEMRAKIVEALSDSGRCAENLGLGQPGEPALADAANPEVIEIQKVTHFLASGQSTVVAKNQLIDGLRYFLALRFPNESAITFPSRLGRPSVTLRYTAQLEVRAQREALKNSNGAQTDVAALIPLSVEFDIMSGKLVSCTLHPDDMDEVLQGGMHTVRDCYHADGKPIPTEVGLICRIPVAVFNPKNYNGAIPNCNTIPVTPPQAPWSNVVGGTNYNTTVSRDITLEGCNGPIHVVTPWHAMSATSVERVDSVVKKGTSDGRLWAIAGATFMVAALTGNAPAAVIIAAAIIVAAIVMAVVPSKCETETIKFYSQVNGIGCR